MLELAAAGAKVLMMRSVEFARNHGVVLHVRSSFNASEGTWVRKEEERMEQAIISGVAHDTSEAKVTIRGVPDRPGVAARVFRPLADAGVNIDMIVQNVSAAGRHRHLVHGSAGPTWRAPSRSSTRQPATVGARGWRTDPEVAKVSLVGAGMKTHPGVAADMFDALADAGINIEIISTSPIRISCVVRAGDVERAVIVLHDKFRLDEEVAAGGGAEAGMKTSLGIWALGSMVTRFVPAATSRSTRGRPPWSACAARSTVSAT